MPTFFVDPGAITPPTVRITGDLLHHLRNSLRLHAGDFLALNDGCGARYRVEVTHVTAQVIDTRIIDQQTEPARKNVPIVLGQALIKGDKMDWVIQKATELGVAAIVPIHSTHSVIKPNPERLEHQRSRWERIARDAAQQSERWTIPTIADPIDLAGICRQYASAPLKSILVERSSGPSLATVPLPLDCQHPIVLLVGPEGGWAAGRAATCAGAGLPSTHPRATNLAGRDRSNCRAQYSPITTRCHSRIVKGVDGET